MLADFKTDIMQAVTETVESRINEWYEENDYGAEGELIADNTTDVHALMQIVLVSNKLQRFQSRAARVLTGANYDIRSADIIQTLSWDTLDARRLCAKSTLMYKILNDDTAPNLRNSFVRRNVDQTDYHLRNSATDLTLPKPKREFLKRSFKYSGAMLWNQLPNEA